MAITIEIDPAGLRVADTTDGNKLVGPSLVTSLTVTEYAWSKITVANATATSIPFGSVAAADLVVIRTSVATTVKLNAEATGHTVNPLFLWADSAGGITAVEVTQSSGAAVTMEYLVAG